MGRIVVVLAEQEECLSRRPGDGDTDGRARSGPRDIDEATRRADEAVTLRRGGP